MPTIPTVNNQQAISATAHSSPPPVTSKNGYQVTSSRMPKNSPLAPSYFWRKLMMTFSGYLNIKNQRLPETITGQRSGAGSQELVYDKPAKSARPLHMTRTEFNDANQLLSEFNIAPMDENHHIIAEPPTYGFVPGPRCVAKHIIAAPKKTPATSCDHGRDSQQRKN